MQVANVRTSSDHLFCVGSEARQVVLRSKILINDYGAAALQLT